MNPVSNLTTSFLLLAIGLTILWLAATNRLGNFINAWSDIAADPGTKGGTSNLTTSISQTVGGPPINNTNVPVTIPGIGTITLPVPGVSGSTGPFGGGTPTVNQLEAGGGQSYRLPQLPSIGTITTH